MSDTNNLDSAYFRQTLEQLQSKEIAWKTQLRPILGYLLAIIKTEPLTKDQLISLTKLSQAKLEQGLEKLHDLITQAERQSQITYSLTDLPLISYLQEGEANSARPIFTTEQIQVLHRNIADWCESDWDNLWQNSPDVEIQNRRNYARKHYITHLYYAGDWERLSQVLDRGEYGRHKIKHFDPKTAAYVLDLNWGRKLASDPTLSYEENLARLPHLWQYSLLRNSLAGSADKEAASFFEAMFKVGQDREALAQLDLLHDPLDQIAVLGNLASLISKQGSREEESKQLLLQAYTIFRQVPINNRASFFALDKLLKMRDFRTAAIQGHALEVIDTITIESIKTWALVVMAQQLVKAGQTEQANQVLQRAFRSQILQEILQSESLQRTPEGEFIQQVLGTPLPQAPELIYTITDCEDESTQILLEIVEQLLRRSVLGQLPKNYYSVDENDLLFRDDDEVSESPGQVEKALVAKALKEIAEQLVGQNDFRQALKIIQSDSDKYEQAEFLIKIAEQLRKNHQINQMKDFLQQAYNLAHTVTYKDKPVFLNDNIVWAISIMGSKQAFNFVRHSLPEKSVTRILIKIAEQLVKAGELNQAKETLLETFDLTRFANDKNQTGVLGSIIEQLALNDQPFTEAFSLDSEYGQLMTIRETVAQLVQQARFEQALDKAHVITNTYHQEEALISIAEQLAQQDNAGQALDLVRSINNKPYNTVVLDGPSEQRTRFADALNKVVLHLTYLYDLKQALDITHSLVPENNRTEILITIAEQLIKAGETTDAKEVLQEAFKLITVIRHYGTETKAFRKIPKLLAELNEASLALQIAHTIPDDTFEASVSNEIIDQLWESNKPDIATEILQVVQHEWLKTPNRKYLVRLLPMVSRFLVGNPDLLPDILMGFNWIDNFLQTI